MLGETHLQDITRQMRHLLSCGSVHIVLGCTVPDLRHPFLDQLLITGYAEVLSDGGSSGVALLQHEHIRGLCDVALYTGQLSASNAMQWSVEGVNIQSIMVAPLEVRSTSLRVQVGTALARPHVDSTSFPYDAWGRNADGLKLSLPGSRGELEVSPDDRASTGIIGLVLCTAACADAFSPGERLLLQQFLPRIIELLIQDTADYIARRIQDSTIDGNRPSTMLRTENPDHPLKLASPVTSQINSLEPLKNEFMTMLSHELRSPLTAIKGYAILLQAYGVSSEHSDTRNNSQSDGEELTPMRQREYLDIIMEQTNHLEVLISDLLDISRIQAGRLALRYSQVNVGELCQRVVQIVQQKTEQQYHNRYTFRCSIDPHLLMVWTDAHRLRQILTNLLENAVKYSPEGGLIEILVNSCDAHSGATADSALCFAAMASASNNSEYAMAESQQTMFAVTIRDNGIGIPLQQQVHLFKPFSRLEHPLTHDVQGIGLGLYITSKLIEVMGGNIHVQSCEGKGTSITFLLPIKQPKKADYTSIGTC